jgi:hypothetical protein
MTIARRHFEIQPATACSHGKPWLRAAADKTKEMPVERVPAC